MIDKRYAYQLQTFMGTACTAGNDKKDLCEISDISIASFAKLGKGENLTTDVLLKIWDALSCYINGIMGTVPVRDEGEKEFAKE